MGVYSVAIVQARPNSDSRTLAIVGVGTLLSLGCGSDRALVPADVAAACARDSAVDCAMIEACEGGWATTLYGSVDACTTRVTEQCERAVTAPGAGYGAAEISTCAANQQAQTCDEWVGIITPGCAYTGLRPAAQPCRDDSQCSTGFCDQYLLISQRNVCGVCAKPPAVGGPCHASCGGDGSVGCVYANPSDALGTCVTLGSAGQTCGASAPCATGLRCAIPPGATSGQCLLARGNVGDPCDSASGPFCDYRRRIYCNAQLGTCAAARDVDPGGACGDLPDGSVGQCRLGACLGAAAGLPGMCVAYLPDGSPCTFGPGTQSCAPPAICASGTCRIVGGELCD